MCKCIAQNTVALEGYGLWFICCYSLHLVEVLKLREHPCASLDSNAQNPENQELM